MEPPQMPQTDQSHPGLHSRMRPKSVWLELIPTIILAAAIHSSANAFLTLHSFAGAPDGRAPNALIQSGPTLYGTTSAGGLTNLVSFSSDNGTIFKFNADGTGYSIIYYFSQADTTSSTNADGAQPLGALLLAGGTLYGSTQTYGPLGGGTVFKVNTDGSNFTVLHTFSSTAGGKQPAGSLLLSGNTLYGATALGSGAANYGTIFRVNTDGSAFTNLYSFSGGTDGGTPTAPLVLAGNALYGTTTLGGSAYGANGSGTIFKLNTDGSGFTTLHTFDSTDGANPYAGLAIAGTNLFGTAPHGGSFGGGTIFSINTDGSGFTNLYSFQKLDDGSTPATPLALLGTVLYGTSGSSGTLHPGGGTIFHLNKDGSAFTTLYSFTNVSVNGQMPNGPLLLSGSTIYATTLQGGPAQDGVAFALTTQLNVQNNGTSVVLTWSDPTFSLQAAPMPQGPYTNLPATSPFTNPATAPAMFFRLVR